ncbi:MAG: uL30 family ribosomal protein [Nanoarchaeota archaeon]|nr:uL30 family ribosomal protein [Nanoarchaeota archaeon]
MKIAIIRIAGQVEQKQPIKETLQRLNLPRKFSCVIIDDSDSVRMGMLNAVKDKVAFGKINDDFANEIEKKKKVGERKYFSLHPPIGGFKKTTKVATPKGILGKHDDISKLLGRML